MAPAEELVCSCLPPDEADDCSTFLPDRGSDLVGPLELDETARTSLADGLRAAGARGFEAELEAGGRLDGGGRVAVRGRLIGLVKEVWI